VEQQAEHNTVRRTEPEHDSQSKAQWPPIRGRNRTNTLQHRSIVQNQPTSIRRLTVANLYVHAPLLFTLDRQSCDRADSARESDKQCSYTCEASGRP